jgi:protein-disulfide isomerase
MEKGDKSPGRWVEKRMAQLEPSAEWQPDAENALTRMKEKGRAAGVRRRQWTLIAGAVVVGSVVVVSLPVCHAESCAIPAAHLAGRLWGNMFHAGGDAATAPEIPGVAPSPAFKVTGAPTASITCEVFTDYECPACAALYMDTIPMLMTEYVATGKVKMVHRDFPLRQHQYSKLAAQYANAAGEAGQYDLAVVQLFRTQKEWSRDGDIDSRLALVLSPDVMEKVRAQIRTSVSLDQSIVTDAAQGAKDQLNQTPSVVVVWKGQRKLMAPVNYGLLKSYLDDLLK